MMAGASVYPVNRVDLVRLDQVIHGMRVFGPPEIQVVKYGLLFQALDGSHRLAAASVLGIVPRLRVLPDKQIIDITKYDWYRSDDWDDVMLPAARVAMELFAPPGVEMIIFTHVELLSGSTSLGKRGRFKCG